MEHRAAFTLLELSIVLIIIGLLAGGVMVGRDLIAAAALRSQITQIEKYNAAANTFRTKYGFLPGDLPANQAASLGFATRTGAYGDGDGDGYVNGKYGASVAQLPTLGGETVFFWTDLSAAQMIEGSFTYSADDGVTATPKQIGLYLPPAKIGQGYVMLYGEGERETPALPGSLQNNFQLVEFNLNISGVASGIVGIFGGPLTPIQAQAFDQKVDDGLPAGGAVSLMISRSPPSPFIMPPQAGRSVSSNISIQNMLDADGSLVPNADDCAVNKPPLAYSASQAKGNLPYCSLRIKAAF